MMDEETQVASPETVEQSAPQEEVKENDKEANFKAIREAKERAERERDEAYKLLKRVEQAQQSQAPQQPASPQEDDDYLAPDELAEGKHLNKMAKKVKDLEKQLKNYHQESSSANTEARLKAQYSDFDAVVSTKNIEELRNLYPEIAKTINESPNLYSKAVTAYTIIKKLGIEKKDVYEKDRTLAEENHNKPRPLTSISPQQGDSPLSHANAFANGLTDDLKKQLYREMEEAKKNL